MRVINIQEIYKYPTAKWKYARIADFLQLGGNTDEEKAELLIKAIDELNKNLNIPMNITINIKDDVKEILKEIDIDTVARLLG